MRICSEFTSGASTLPIELRAAIDLVAARCTDASGEIGGIVVGSEHLRTELDQYARRYDVGYRIIALDPEPDTLAEALAAHDAQQVWCISTGPIHRLLRPFRRAGGDGIKSHEADLSGILRERGYVRSARTGIQGPGFVVCALGERIFHRLRRPDLADRCRIAMLRSLITLPPFHAGAISLTTYLPQGRSHV